MASMAEERIELDQHISKAMFAAARKDWRSAETELVVAVDKLTDLSLYKTGRTQEIMYDWVIDLMDELKKIRQAGLISISEELGKTAKGKADASTETPEEAYVPKLKFDDIAGLENVKETVKYRAIMPIQYTDGYKLFNKSQGGGILLYGLPGTGKTMIAEAIACEIGAKFFPIRCSDIGSKWFGETEKNIGEIFDKARKCDRAVIFFDEIEAYAAERGESDVTERAVNELLSQMQGSGTDELNKNLLIIAATNKPWKIDGAFLRPGRFDEKIYVSLPDVEARKKIIDLALKGVPCEKAFDSGVYAGESDGFNGADVKFLCENAKEEAIKRVVERGGQKRLLRSDFNYALSQVKSSVRTADKEEMLKWASGN